MPTRLLTAIRDIKAGEFYGSIVTVRTVEEAQRNFMNILETHRDSDFHRHPKDFHMYVLGSIETETGQIEAKLPSDITPHSNVDAYLDRKEEI